jgi:hypothetical protein
MTAMPPSAELAGGGELPIAELASGRLVHDFVELGLDGFAEKSLFAS